MKLLIRTILSILAFTRIMLYYIKILFFIYKLIPKKKNLVPSLQKNRPVPAFLQTAVIDKPIPALFAGALQSAAIGGL